MPDVIELLKKSADFLEEKGIESPRLNAEIMLADVLNCRRLDLYLMFDRPLDEPELEKFRSYIRRRIKFEPVQYIVGKTWFYGEEFTVNRNALIPRQETEILIEEILTDTPADLRVNILDIGTGTGNIPIILSKHLPEAVITSIDISKAAISLAEENERRICGNDKINFVNKGAEEFINDPGKKFDIIVSNPPYVSVKELPALQKEITGFEPEIAVTDKADGLSFYRLITGAGKKLLNPRGKLYFELGKGQHTQVAKFMSDNGFIDVSVKKDYAGIERVIKGEIYHV